MRSRWCGGPGGLVWWAVFLCCAVAAEPTPRTEHPRPDFRRDTWHSLNGPWQFRFDPEDRGLKDQWWTTSEGWDRRIVVPFCWESRASGVADTTGQKIGWYRRELVVPQAWRGRRVWIRFGAVDHEATVWVNGAEVGRHEGGFTPFEFDVTERAKPGGTMTVVVRARNATDAPPPAGTQDPVAFTPTSGIWQTVWLEARPPRHVRDFRLTPKDTGAGLSLDAELEVAGPDGPAQIELASPNEAFSTQQAELTIRDGPARHWATIHVPSAKLWSPERPHLYDLQIRVRGGQDAQEPADLVHTYFALRTIGRGDSDESGRPMILLNDRPVYLRGAVDRSFNPEGLCTAPTDAFLRRDVEIARQLGLNFLRIDAGAEEPRWLYWADRMGVLVMEDVPCAGAEKAGTQAAREIIQRARNHPAIVIWGLSRPSGELAGHAPPAQPAAQTPARSTWTEVKEKLDSSRLIAGADGSLAPPSGTDLGMAHVFMDDYSEARQQIERLVRRERSSPTGGADDPDRRPFLISQQSGVFPHGGDRDVSWSFRYLTTLLRQFDSIAGHAYTSLTDVEWVHDGLVNYDRTPKQFGYGAFVPGMTVADLLGADFVGYDAPPVLVLDIEESFTLPVFVSHYSSRRDAPTLQWQIAGTDDMGQDVLSQPEEMQAVWRPHQVTFQKLLTVKVPGRRPFVGALGLELLDNDGERIAANYVNLIVRRAAPPEASGSPTASRLASPRVEVLGPRLVALRFSPDDFAAFHGDAPMPHWFAPRSRFYGHGKCDVEYKIALPDFVRSAIPTQVVLMAELATKAQTERLDWPNVRHELDYPQTEDRKHPGKIAVRLEGRPLWRFDLPDDPADSRGVLSHAQRWQHGSYGYLVHKRVDLFRDTKFRDALRAAPSVSLVFETMEETIDGKPRWGGLSLFGENLGRYPIDPTLIIQTSRDLSHSPGWTSQEPVAVERLLDRVRREAAIPTGAQGGHAWRYTTDPPPADWFAVEAPDAQWHTGRGAFGRPGAVGLRVGTPWTTPDIWLRTHVELDTVPEEVLLNLDHAGAGEIYLNGKPLLTRSEGPAEAQSIPLSKAQRNLLQTGRNIVAVHARQDAAGQGLDVGLEWIRITP